MQHSNTHYTRRQALYGLGGVSALALVPGCAGSAYPANSSTASQATASGPDAKLDEIAFRMLEHEPGRATGLGVDTGQYGYLRGTLGASGQTGREAYRATLTDLLADARSYPRAGLTADQTIGFEVVESAFATALEGMALPYGDVAVGSWRNAPYLVIQNVGGYIDFPRFFGATQPVRSADDVTAYIDRLSEVPAVLDGETDRIKEARAMGVIPPDFLLDKTIAQMEASIASAGEGGPYANPLEQGIADNLGEIALGVLVVGVIDCVEPRLAVDRKVAHAGRRLAATASVDAFGVLPAGHLYTIRGTRKLHPLHGA